MITPSLGPDSAPSTGIVAWWDRWESDNAHRTWIAIIARWRAIGGRGLAWGMALNFFLAVLPVVVIFTSLLASIHRARSYGDLLASSLGLRGHASLVVRNTFARANGHTFAVLGVSGFLFLACGLDLATAGQQTFAKGWGRLPDTGWRSVVRGMRWFFAMAVSTVLTQWLAFATKDRTAKAVVVDASIFLVVQFGLWLITPRLLVDKSLSLRELIPGAIVGALVSAAFRIASVFVLPGSFGWYADAFGPAGVVMAVVSWYVLMSFGWVFIAIAGGILAERRRPMQVL